MPQRFAIEQQIFWIQQQTIVMHQIVKIFCAVEKFIVLHPLWHHQGDGAIWRYNFAWSWLRHKRFPSVCYIRHAENMHHSADTYKFE